MVFIYNIGIRLYILAIRLAAIRSKKAKQWLDGRRKWQKKLSEIAESVQNPIWVHAASLGEFEQGRPVIEKWKAQFPNDKIVLTFFSPSGYGIRKNYAHADAVMYLPVDTAVNARKFIEILRPKCILFVKYELWYHYLNEADKKNVPFYLISGIFRKNQLFFKPYGRWYLKKVKTIRHFFVQNTPSKQLLAQNGISHATITGDTRFDRVAETAQQANEVPVVKAFVDAASHVLIAGSTWPDDEKLIANYLNNNPNIKCIIAPHEIHESHIQQITGQLKNNYLRYSKISDNQLKNARVLIIDNIGMLSNLYQYAHVAYIGGGFGNGIHNILEAATFGLPVVFGPNHQKFAEAVDLIDAGGALPINDYSSLKKALDITFTDEHARQTMSGVNKNYVLKNTGATETIVRQVSGWLYP